MASESVTEPAFVIKVDELPALNFLNPDHPRPLMTEWINRGTDQKMRRSTIDQMLRTMNQVDPSPSVAQLQQSAGLRVIFASDGDRNSFATAFAAARMHLTTAQQYLVAAMFEGMTQAEQAIELLHRAGIPDTAITVLSRAGEFTLADAEWRGHSKSSVAAAVASGGLTGALIGIGVLALGPVAIPLAALSSFASISAVFGATGGAMMRMLTDSDVDGREANYYEKQIRRGRVFVAVDTRQVPNGREAVSQIFKQAAN